MAKIQEILTYREKMGHSKYEDPGIDCSKDMPLTEQAHKDDCDINTILARYEKSGQFPDTPKTIEDAFGDFGNIPDLQTVLNVGIEAQRAFMELPAKVRTRFDNNPGKLWNFIHEEGNEDEAVRLGLKVRKKTEPNGDKQDDLVSVSTVTSSGEKASTKSSAQKGADKGDV